MAAAASLFLLNATYAHVPDDTLSDAVFGVCKMLILVFSVICTP